MWVWNPCYLQVVSKSSRTRVESCRDCPRFDTLFIFVVPTSACPIHEDFALTINSRQAARSFLCRSGNIGANTSKYCFTKSAIDFL